MKQRKGIILAGGADSSLHPLTLGVCKQILPIYDKPMIYYPLSVLMLAGIRDILIITTAEGFADFSGILGDGSQFGITISYACQTSPNGLAEAFLIGENFIQGDKSCLILGDNIFYGQNFSHHLQKAAVVEQGATIFAHHVANPEQFGVITFNDEGRITAIEEKPVNPKSSYVATGLYFYDDRVVEVAKNIRPSARGKLEITDINQFYLQENSLNVELLGRGFAWLDTTTPEALLEAGHFVHTIEERQGLKVACLEEIAFHSGWISADELYTQALRLQKTPYGHYLLQLLNR